MVSFWCVTVADDSEHRNPFRFGALALDDAFMDREDEVAELRSDVLNGQDVVIFAPRRYGKSSLAWRTAQELVRRRVLVAQVDLMTTPTKEKLAEKLAKQIHENIASVLFRAKERLQVFRGLRIAPTVTIDPEDGSVGFSFEAGRRPEDVDATLERLLQLPAQLSSERERKVVLILDEFQEVVEIDPDLPKLMRSVFQEQPDVAHIYLGSKRHMMERIFSDENEPFWRSAKQMELGVIPVGLFRRHIEAAFARGGLAVEPEALDAVLAITGGHPYATQELCYSLWEKTVVEGRPGRPGCLRRRARCRASLRERPLQPRVGPRHIAAAPRAARPGARARPPAGFRLPAPARPSRSLQRPAGAAEPRARGAGGPRRGRSTASPSRSWRNGSSATPHRRSRERCVTHYRVTRLRMPECARIDPGP